MLWIPHTYYFGCFEVKRSEVFLVIAFKALHWEKRFFHKGSSSYQKMKFFTHPSWTIWISENLDT